MDSMMYTTPSPVTAKRRLSSNLAHKHGRHDRVVSEHIQRIQREWPDLHDDRTRRGSVGNVIEFAQSVRDESDSLDSSMGFRELERVACLIAADIAYRQNQTTEFRFEARIAYSQVIYAKHG